MTKQKKTLKKLLMITIGLPLMMLAVGCAKQNEFVMREGIDRKGLKKGDTFTATESSVCLSDRAFKFYAEGCPK